MQKLEKRQQELERSEAHYHLLFESIKDGIALSGAQTGILEQVNEALCVLVERPREDLLDHPLTVLHPPQETGLYRQIFEDFAAGKLDPADLDLEVQTASGARIPVDISNSRLTLEGRHFLLSIYRDTRDAKAKQAALEESEARLAESNQLLGDVLEHTHMMAALLDPQFNFIWVNRAYADRCRHEASFFSGKNHFELYPHAENQSIFQRVVATGEPFFASANPLEFPDPSERGVTHWDWSLIPVKNDAGKVTGLVFTLTEVSDRIRAEQALAASEHRFRSVLETVSLIGVMLGLEGNIILCNDFLLDPTGWAREDVLQKNWFDLFLPAEIRREIREEVFLKTTEAGAIPAHHQNVIITRTGEQRLIEWSNTVLLDLHGAKSGVASIGQDITERKKAEEALRESESRYRLLFERNLAGVYRSTLDGQILNCNDAFAKMFGWESQEEMGSLRAQALYKDPSDRERFIARLRRTAASPTTNICSAGATAHFCGSWKM